MKTCNFHARLFLPPVTRHHLLRLAGLLAGTTVLGSSPALATGWTGTVSNDWNNVANWNSASGGTATITVAAAPPFIATITANIVPANPSSMLLGASAAARVDHRAGNAGLAADGDITLGRSTGGNATYNLANTGATGGILTGFGQGSGNLTVPRHIFVGGSVGPGIGTLNIHTTGTLAVGGQLLVGNLGTSGGAGTGTVKMDSGTLTVVNDLEIGNGTGATGTFSMSGGTVTKSGAGTAVGVGGGARRPRWQRNGESQWRQLHDRRGLPHRARQRLDWGRESRWHQSHRGR